MTKTRISKHVLWEILFQVILLAVVFVFYSYERRNYTVEAHEVAFFLSYAGAAMLINYWLLPRFLYHKKYLLFGIFISVVIALVIFIEEGVLEQIYFPDTRGLRFPGVFMNLASAMPTITILTGFKFAWDALTRQREVEQLKSAVKESELQFLKTQINPHFLFNNLNNLYAHALEQSPRTPEIILELSGVLRYMLYECQADTVPLKKEIEQLENFLNLGKLQLEGRAEISFKTEQIQGNYQIAPLILIVFLENALKHSSSSQTENIKILASFSLNEEGILHFFCRNTYSPQSNTDELSHGIGLENVKKRLNLLYPNAHELEILTDGKTYEVRLSMDLKIHETS